MHLAKRACTVIAATALAMTGLGVATADTVGPAIKYFKAPIPVVGSTLSDSSGTPSFSLKDGWAVNDGDGVCSATTQLYREGVGWSTVWNAGGTPATTSLSGKHTWTTKVGGYDYLRTTASDCLSNTSSGYDYLSTGMAQQGAASYSAGWATAACACWSGGSVMRSSTAGARATYTFSGRLVSLVSARAAGRGTVSLSVDGGPAQNVSLGGTTLNRVIVWNSKYLSTGSHLLTVKVVSGRVDIDAFLTQG